MPDVQMPAAAKPWNTRATSIPEKFGTNIKRTVAPARRLRYVRSKYRLFCRSGRQEQA
jgi:hypothetical protein